MKPSIRQQVIHKATITYENQINAIPELIKAMDLARAIKRSWLNEVVMTYRPNRKADDPEVYEWSSQVYINLYLSEEDTADKDVIMLLDDHSLDSAKEPSKDSDYIAYDFGKLRLRFWFNAAGKCKVKRIFKSKQSYDTYDYEIECE